MVFQRFTYRFKRPIISCEFTKNRSTQEAHGYFIATRHPLKKKRPCYKQEPSLKPSRFTHSQPVFVLDPKDSRSGQQLDADDSIST